MLYDIHTDRRPGQPAAGVATRPVSADETHFDPWLLWRPEVPATPHVLTVAEMAECVCPELCNRDHVNE
jgi:hypothetical protein